jgi:hypothetical protein
MNTENFLELMTSNPTATVQVSRTSIAAIESTSTGCTVTLKEKRPDGTQIAFNVSLPYTHVINEINKWEKTKP